MILEVVDEVDNLIEVERITTIIEIADFDVGLRQMLEADQANTTIATDDITLTDSSKVIQFIDPGGADRIINLPTASIDNHGFAIVNTADAAETLTVKSGATTLGILQQDGGVGWFISNGTEWKKLGGGGQLTIEEEDGSPSVDVSELHVPNDLLVDVGGGIAQLFPSGVFLDRACLFFQNFKLVSGTPTPGWTGNLADFYGGCWVSDTGSADGDAWEHEFSLRQGSYTIRARGSTYSTFGKLDYYIDDVLVSSGQDWYSASAVHGVTKTISSISIATSGMHKIKIKVNGKTGTAYKVALSSIDIYPT